MRRWSRVIGAAAGACLLCGGGGQARAGDRNEGGAGRPHLDLRATPRMAFPPANVFVVAELKGQPGEEFYCPGLVWEWGDGSKSAEEGDCPPYQAGATLERFFSARHAYAAAGSYPLKLTLRRADRTLAVATLQIVLYGSTAEP